MTAGLNLTNIRILPFLHAPFRISKRRGHTRNPIHAVRTKAAAVPFFRCTNPFLPHQAFLKGSVLVRQVMDVAIPPVPSNAPWLDRAVIVKPEREWHGASPAELRGWYGANEDPLLVFHGLFRRFDRFDNPDEHVSALV